MIFFSELTRCEKVDVVGKVSQSLFGFFHFIDQYNDRPAYQNNNKTLYFYYEITTDCEYWTVGDKLGNSSSVAFTFDAPLDPVDIANPWRMSYTVTGGVWLEDDNIRVFCV